MDFKELKKLVGEENRVILREDIDKKYLTDGLNQEFGEADALVFAENSEEVKKVIKFANDNKIHVTIRGSGTGLTGATIPLHRGIILDFSKMNKILELDEENLTLTVEPGVLLQDVQAFVEEKNYFYPPDPGEKTATIGGNVSTNAGGMRAVKYGVTRNYVHELEVITGDGRKLVVGGKTIKNSSGLDLKDLIIGSEGTLAVITKIVLKIIPKPEKSVSVLIPFNNLKDGVNSVISLIKANSNPTAIEFMERKLVENSEKFLDLKLPYDGGECFLLLTFDGDENSIKINEEKARNAVLNSKALDFLVLDEKQAEDTWKIRGALASAITINDEQIPIDIVVPITKISDFAEFTSNLGEGHKIQVIYFGHAGDGNIHVSVMRNHREINEWKRISAPFLEKLYKKSYELGGIPSGEHGIGLEKRPYFLQVTDDTNIQIMRSIKNVFDVNGILNVGKVYS
ncbi:FAD-binding oxidoreductase [uncultured Clostridium sp.]|uniref:FAD-binding oxidoreductase n=1 Tax=uncultured Clostridium sp. TaxID=59620 RepID=UPI0025DBE713|nr:FAD-binding oxidoreductase [uncultured Clostridium sp.]